MKSGKYLSRTARIVVAVALGGAALGITGSDRSEAVVTTVGACSGHRANIALKSTFIWPADLKPAGVTDKNHDLTETFKGVHAVGGTVGTIGGTCGFVQAVASGATTTAPAGVRTLLKWSSKVTSPVADCATDVDAAEWPNSGKLSLSYTDLTKTDAYITEAAPTGLGADLQSYRGVVTKGIAVGAQVTNEYAPVPTFKDKTVVTDWDGTEILTEFLAGGTPADRAVIQGQSIYGGAIACNVVTEPPAETFTMRTSVAYGSGLSPLLGTTIGGITFTIGAA